MSFATIKKKTPTKKVRSGNKKTVTEILRLKEALKLEKQKVKLLEKQIKANQQDFRAVAENAPDVICRFDRKNRHVYVNPALEKATGAPTHAFIGRTPHQAGLPQEFADFWVHHITQIFAKPALTTIEFSFPSPQGEKHFQAVLVPEFNNRGKAETVLSITRDITEMKLQQNLKDNFLGMVSHELKTPVTSLKLYVDLVQRQLQKSKHEKSIPYIKKIDTSVAILTKLIDDLLEATRMGSGHLQYQTESFDLNQLVEDVVNDMKLVTKTHKFIFTHQLQPNQVMGDRGRIYQVLINLLSNAIKYSPPRSKVIITIRATNTEEVTCQIQDFGIGIPPEQQSKIFEQFFRVENTEYKHQPGVGLGLYIASAIIKKHGGKISVESQEGKGSTFRFTLPLIQKPDSGN